MKKSTVAAIVAASFVGFGAVGSAFAEGTATSGWVDVRYYSIYSPSSGIEGQFTTWGEVDLVHQVDSQTLRIDLDVLNGGGVDGGAAGLGMGSASADPAAADTNVNVEQANLTLPVMDLADVTLGIWNTPIGYEGQDSPDLPFASNGLLWDHQPTNHAGGRVDIDASDMVSVTVGYANDWQGTSEENSIMAVVGVTPMEGLSGALGYITTEDPAGNLFDLWVEYGMEMFSVYAEYMLGDPDTASDHIDNGWGIGGEVSQGMFGGAVRYEMAEIESAGTNPEPTELSLAVFANLSETDRVAVDWTNVDPDTTTDMDIVTIQYLRTFGDDGMM
jgi:hypothetical protein